MSGGKHIPLVVNGWTVFAHPLFLDEFEALTRQVEALKHKDPVGFILMSLRLSSSAFLLDYKSLSPSIIVSM